MRKFTICACFMLMSLSLASCSTVEGMGKDVRSAGDTIQRTF
ncbi:MAG: entericidin A/B family lipoprotein [Alphaproteobacteria bacterium]|nr:entericidin A/B family lipoprotein [Alphaproteobacteria bacterium]